MLVFPTLMIELVTMEMDQMTIRMLEMIIERILTIQICSKNLSNFVILLFELSVHCSVSYTLHYPLCLAI